MADPANLETIRSIAVDAEAVVDAFVYSRENPDTAVLRVTPPFHGRMRARLHVARDRIEPEAVDDGVESEGAYVRAADLLAPATVEAYPTLDAGSLDEDELERARTAHTRAIEEWRARARESIVDRVTLPGGHEVRVTRLG